MKNFMKVLLSMARSGSIKMKESIEGKTDEQVVGALKTELGIQEQEVVSIPVEKLKPLLALEGEQLKAALAELVGAMGMDEAEKKAALDAEEAKKKAAIAAVEGTATVAKESAFSKKLDETMNALKLERCGIALENMLVKESALTDEAKSRIRESLKGKEFTDVEAAGKIKAEKEYVEHILESTVKADRGYVRIVSTPQDKLSAALDLMVDPDLKNETEYKESHSGLPAFNGFRDAIKRMDNLDVEDFLRADNKGRMRMKEATTANFTVALGDSMNKSLIRNYKRFREREVWTKFVTEENFTNLNQQKLFRFGGFQDLDTVAEAGTYQETNTPSETQPTYTPFKKGNLFTLTEEMIINDNLRAMKEFPVGMARAGVRTLSKFVFGLVTGYDGSDNLNVQTIYDSKTLYHNDHGGNRTSNALTLSNFDTACAVMMNQTEDTGSDEPLGIRAKYLLVSPTLRRTAWDATVNELVQANANGGSIQNALKEYGVEALTVPEGYLAFRPNAWFLIGDPLDAEGIRIGYFNGKREPEILLQDAPNVDDVFTNDKIRYRVKFRYGGAVVDYRPFYGGIVS